MRDRSSIRVAAVQLASGDNLAANLKGCLRMIDRAAPLRPGLIVLPEFCNHVSWYEDRAHCFRVSVALNSGFLRAIAGKAREHQTHIVINCTDCASTPIRRGRLVRLRRAIRAGAALPCG